MLLLVVIKYNVRENQKDIDSGVYFYYCLDVNNIL